MPTSGGSSIDRKPLSISFGVSMVSLAPWLDNEYRKFLVNLSRESYDRESAKMRGVAVQTTSLARYFTSFAKFTLRCLFHSVYPPTAMRILFLNWRRRYETPPYPNQLGGTWIWQHFYYPSVLGDESVLYEKLLYVRETYVKYWESRGTSYAQIMRMGIYYYDAYPYLLTDRIFLEEVLPEIGEEALPKELQDHLERMRSDSSYAALLRRARDRLDKGGFL